MSNRIRRHADPFQCRIALSQDDWLETYRARGLDAIWLDLGCGKGELMASMAEVNPDVFFIGIELRKKIAEKFFPEFSHISNLLLLHGNVNLSIPSMMGQKKVQRVFINFPDPCDFKLRYKKRQMVNERLVHGIRDILTPDGIVSIKTDRQHLFQEMDSLFRSRMKPFKNLNPAYLGYGARSEWEADCLKKSNPIFSREYCL